MAVTEPLDPKETPGAMEPSAPRVRKVHKEIPADLRDRKALPAMMARKVRKDGSLAARSSDVRFYRSDKIPDWLAPVIAEHTPEWAR